jgi:hypothetical protein
MPRRKAVPEPLPPKAWTLPDIERGIEKLKRRVADVQSLQTDQVHYDDGRVDSVKSSIVATIEDVFGTGSRENRENRYISFHKGQHFRAGFHESGYVIDQRAQQAFVASFPDVITLIEGLIGRLEEKKQDFKHCPQCGRIFNNEYYCLVDGSTLGPLADKAEADTLIITEKPSIEQRLAKLAELRDKGLIDERDFQARKEKILEEV